VISGNDGAAVAHVANAVSKHEGAVANLKIVNRQREMMEILVDVDVRDTAHLAKVIAGLRGAQGVVSVERAHG
jgi:GTP pyrophosphokinase